MDTPQHWDFCCSDQGSCGKNGLVPFTDSIMMIAVCYIALLRKESGLVLFGNSENKKIWWLDLRQLRFRVEVGVHQVYPVLV